MAALPVQLADERLSLFGSRLFWAGVAVAAGIGLWNGAIVPLAPNLFAVPTLFDYETWIANLHPWNFIRYTDFSWGPWELGLCYLMPLDMTFSLIVFDLIWTSQYVLAGQLGWAVSPWAGVPYGERQVVGAVGGLFLAALWLDRRYLIQVLRKAVGLHSILSKDSEEALSYRTAIFGVAVGYAFLWWILARAGMQAWVGAMFLFLFLLISMTVTRIRAQLGPPSHELQDAMPDTILYTFVGSLALTPRTLGVIALLRPYLVLQRNNPVPIQLEAMKMAEDGRMDRRHLALVVAALVPIAMLCYFWASLHLGYNQGFGTAKTDPAVMWMPRDAAEGLVGHLRFPMGPDPAEVTAVGVGLLLTLALMWLKLNVHWWLLHPVAYPIALGWMTHRLLPAMLFTWLLKILLLRYGRLHTHRRALMFFLGLLVGSATQFWVQRISFMLLGLPLE